MAEDKRLPRVFLRGLEADLRALCADARKRNPELKDAAERVILSLKEADTVDSEREAADEAASAFCQACETLDLKTGSSALNLQVKVALRAVSCLHKLLTHRALSPERLPEVLDALQQLSSPPQDDNLTLKVLQGLLSLLTVRSYAKALCEEDLSRAFSLLFTLRTSRSNAGGTAASNALSAISQLSNGSDAGVIEQTSKAAFRQVSSDLFASASDSALRKAVEKQSPSGAFIPLSEFPCETRAAHNLFLDLCYAASNEELSWLAYGKSANSSFRPLDLALALEVIDDGLSNNISLFAGQQVFSEVLSSRLCPVLHKLIRTIKDKSTMKSLLGLVVTITRNYWRILRPDCEALLFTLTKMSSTSKITSGDEIPWDCMYAMESLRCIVKVVPGEPTTLVDFTQAFDLQDGTGDLAASIVATSCDAMELVNRGDITPLPSSPLNSTMKPFANTMTNSYDHLISIATGLYLEIIKGANEAAKKGLDVVACTLLKDDSTERAIRVFEKILGDSPGISSARGLRLDVDGPFGAVEALCRALGEIAVIATKCQLDSLREVALGALSGSCMGIIRNRRATFVTENGFAKKVGIMYGVLFEVQSSCRESLGQSWLPVMEALEYLDFLIRKVEAVVERGESPLPAVLGKLKPQFDRVFTVTGELQWSSCHDMISALVQCSRHSVSALSKRSNTDDQGKTDVSTSLRVFGISKAEVTIVNALKRQNTEADPVPCKLWQLLTGHLTSVCNDSVFPSLRQFALSSLTTIACAAIPSGSPNVIGHEKIVMPFVDLLASSHSDVRLGSLSAVYTVMVTQGERLTGEAAWTAVLKILSTAAGSTFAPETNEDAAKAKKSSENRPSMQASGSGQGPALEMMSEAFKIVQAIADDFLSSLVDSTLPGWIEILGLYSRQDDDVNVALTAIGLLWRTADFFAKNTKLRDTDELWIQLFETLKGISTDGRPEIRNCAVKTLTGSLSTHGLQLSAMAWKGCVAHALLPLLEEVMRGRAHTSQSDEISSLGKSRGDVQLLLHHSRDTPRKQWNETRVLALAGVAKVLRAALPRLTELRDQAERPLFLMLTDGGADGLWRKMLRAAGVAAGSRDGEVAIAGVAALIELLRAAGFAATKAQESESMSPSPKAISPADAAAIKGQAVSEGTTSSWISGVIRGSPVSDLDTANLRDSNSSTSKDNAQSTILMWEAVWSAIAEAIGVTDEDGARRPCESSAVNEESKIVNEKALQMLAEGILDARDRLSSKFTSRSSKTLVHVLLHLARGARTHQAALPDQNSSSLTLVQEKTLAGMRTLSFGSDTASWVGLMNGLLQILEEQGDMINQPMKLERQVLEIIGHLYTSDNVPSEVKTSNLRFVLETVGKVMLLRGVSEETVGNQASSSRSNGAYIVPIDSQSGAPLWISATEVVMMAMKCGNNYQYGSHSDEVWDAFVGIVEEFLYSPHRVQREPEYRRDVEEGDRAEKCDIMLTGCVQEALSAMDLKMSSPKTQRRLVGLLAKGAEEGKASGRPRYVRSCQKRLFKLASGVWTGRVEGNVEVVESVAEDSNQCVVEMCGRVLGQFIADGQRAGRCPLPAARRAEAVFLLQQLRRLNSHNAKGEDAFSKKHLVILYPRLCECVDSRDEAVRQLARELLDATAPAGARERGQSEYKGIQIKTH